jgi:hypothetical protein
VGKLPYCSFVGFSKQSKPFSDGESGRKHLQHIVQEKKIVFNTVSLSPATMMRQV